MAPIISKVFPETAPGATQKATRPPRTCPWGHQMAPYWTHGTPDEPQRPQKRPPKPPYMIPRGPRAAPKPPKAPKGQLKRHAKGTTTTRGKTMQPASRQRFHRRYSQPVLLRKRSRPSGMRGALRRPTGDGVLDDRTRVPYLCL